MGGGRGRGVCVGLKSVKEKETGLCAAKLKKSIRFIGQF